MSTSIELTNPSPVPSTTTKRRHDLDSLRAIAMLLGIVLHSSQSFGAIPWTVKDVQQSDFYVVLLFLIHGFRMPLFFLLSGFFTAMLWRKRGLGGLFKQRAKRILLPLIIGCLTIIPAMWGVSILVSQSTSDARETKFFDAAAAGDTETVRAAIESKEIAIDALHPGSGASLLTVAAFSGQTEMVEFLLQQGADANQRNGDAGTPLHVAVFMGRADAVEKLLEAGADPKAKDGGGNTPKDNLKVDFGTTNYIAQRYGATLDENELKSNRAEIAQMLGEDTAVAGDGASSGQGFGALYGLLFLLPAFMHLWFLAFLCWLVVAFAAYSLIAKIVNVEQFPKWLFCSPLSLLWLVPLTMLLQSFMQPGVFGPDTSIGLLPIPRVLGYYAIFFFFGAIYWDLNDSEGMLGRRWYVSLPVALLIVFPIGLDLVAGTLGFLPKDFGGTMRGLLGNLMQALFVWLMVFGSIGMFRQLFSAESKTMRYISDSSYWLYLAHLPLVILAQWFVKDLPIPAMFKFVGIVVVVSAVLLLTYEYLIRYTIVGSMLNGPRKREQQAQVAAD
jgi:peptidoglycan/LPS O-acetylase OafA/YrhL